MTKRKLFDGAVRASGTAGTITVVASTRARDRMGDTIDPAGWQLANYRRNPIVLYGHDYSSLPVGSAPDVRTTAEGLVATIRFADHPFAQQVYELYRSRMLNAVSVGFQPIRWVHNDEEGGIDYLEQELLEISAVPVPANPEALAIARSMAAADRDLLEGDELYIELAADDQAYIVLEPDPPPVRLRFSPDPLAARTYRYDIDPSDVRREIAKQARLSIRQHLSQRSGRLL